MGLITRWLIQHEAGDEDLECPMFACDTCQMPIDDPRMGLVLFGPDGDSEPGVFRRIRGVYHKTRCDPTYRTREFVSWSELTTFTEQLARNVADPPATWRRTKASDPH